MVWGVDWLVGDSRSMTGKDWEIVVQLRKPDRKSTRLNSSHLGISYAVFCLKKKIQSVETKARPMREQNPRVLNIQPAVMWVLQRTDASQHTNSTLLSTHFVQLHKAIYETR